MTPSSQFLKNIFQLEQNKRPVVPLMKAGILAVAMGFEYVLE